MVTLKEIAARVGVSYETVSRALNRRGRVSEATAKRVREVAREMGYTPNAIARGLRGQRTQSIGVIFPCIYENEFYAGIYRGLEDAMLADDYILFLCNSDFDPGREAAYLQSLRSRQVDGIVAALADSRPDGCANEDEFQALLATSSPPLVLVDRNVQTLATDFVASDHEGGARQAVEHLVELGHRRIGFIGMGGTSSVVERLTGYRSVLEKHGMSMQSELVVHGAGWLEADGSEAMGKLLDLPETQRPTAVFVANDHGAIGALQTALGRGMAVPEELSIVGFDDIRIAANFQIPLTTVRQETREIGRQAAKLLLEHLAAGSAHDPGKREVRVPTRLIVRESSAPPRD